MSISDAFKVITANPAKNLALKSKGHIKLGFDADFCAFNSALELTDVFARGKQMMRDKEVIVFGNFENKNN